LKRHKTTHLGRKILYSAVIGMSGLILLFSMIGILAVWLVQGPLSDAAVSLLHVVESSARVGRVSVGRVDQALAALQAQVTDVVDASSQISQNVTDKGLVLVLLPEEKELQLVETAGSIRDTYQGLRESIALGLDMYRSLNRLPFVSLPGPDEAQMDRIETSLNGLQASVKALRTEIAGFRSGVTKRVDKVTQAASLLNNEIARIRDDLAQLDSKLAGLEVLSIRVQKMIPGLFIIVAVLLTLMLAFLIFTQVEVIRLYLNRWRRLGDLQSVPVVDLPAQTS
jgi:hypothetical protein